MVVWNCAHVDHESVLMPAWGSAAKSGYRSLEGKNQDCPQLLLTKSETRRIQWWPWINVGESGSQFGYKCEEGAWVYLSHSDRFMSLLEVLAYSSLWL